ncbi:cache domain-containing sensor histidine kinase [Paenibacillus radicis (ex Xue et al. 2023)]|uniref:histidine kinase n=1 Tax=Paenibacillus radicis (ex Xue et al. 2023) TaxID=2972489 RepID=A0ABT1YJ29_9BACL|nr:sensor histidine kinase [Paenibacillus radicis (ex Xue et al. 2023)]MCR8633186.1 sensor histidine kinase [Paenibacillus radicis (ex Xue et al. 2023)]
MKIGSLFNQLVSSYIVLIVIPIALIGWMSFKASEELLMVKISETNRQTTGQIERNIITLIDQVTAVVNMNNLNQNLESYLIKSYTNPYEQLTDRANVEKNMMQVSLAFDWMQFESYIIGKNGLVYSTNDSSGVVNTEWFSQLPNEPMIRKYPDQIWWTGTKTTYIKNQGNQNYFNAVKLLHNVNKRSEYGVFILSIKEDSLYRIYRDSINSEAAFFIIDREGRYVTHSHRELVGQLANSEVIERVGIERNNEGTSTIYEGNTITSIKYLEIPGWTLVMNVSVQSLFKDIQGLSNSIFLMALILVGISVFAAVWMSRRIATPLIRLNQRLQAYRIKGGPPQTNTVVPEMNELVLLTTEYEQMVRKLEHTIHELVRNQEEKRNAEWNALQAQINPHFLYNTLNSIKCLLWINKTEYIEPTINALVKLLQMTIQRKDDEITLREEIACLEYYVYIQEIRLSRKIILRTFIDEALWSCHLPKLLLQPIVENAIFHGIERKPEDQGEAIITLYAVSYIDDIRIEITDNGVGMDLEQLRHQEVKQSNHQFNGIGMRNVHERLQMNYGSRYGLSVHSIPGEGTAVTLTLPVREAK